MQEVKRGGRPMEYWGGFLDMSLVPDINVQREAVPQPGGSVTYLPRYIPQVRVEDHRPQVMKKLAGTFPLKKRTQKKQELADGETPEWINSDSMVCWNLLRVVRPYLTIKRRTVESLLDFLEERLTYRSTHDSDPATRRDRKQIEKETALMEIFETTKKTPFTGVYVPNPEELAGILDRVGSMRIKVDSSGGRDHYRSMVSLKSPHTGLIAGLKASYPREREANNPHLWEVTGRFARPVLLYIKSRLLFRGEICRAVLDFQLHQERIRAQHLASLRGRSGFHPDVALVKRDEERRVLYEQWINAKVKAHEDLYIKF